MIPCTAFFSPLHTISFYVYCKLEITYPTLYQIVAGTIIGHQSRPLRISKPFRSTNFLWLSIPTAKFAVQLRHRHPPTEPRWYSTTLKTWTHECSRCCFSLSLRSIELFLILYKNCKESFAANMSTASYSPPCSPTLTTVAIFAILSSKDKIITDLYPFLDSKYFHVLILSVQV